MSKTVVFVSNSGDIAVTYSNGINGHTVTGTSCSCMYFSAMSLPCRHIFSFLVVNELELFVPELCARRWTKDYYYNSHPALQDVTDKDMHTPLPVSFAKPKVPSEIDKYKKTAAVTKVINDVVSNMSNAQFEFYFDKIKSLRNEMTMPGHRNATEGAVPVTQALTSSTSTTSSASSSSNTLTNSSASSSFNVRTSNEFMVPSSAPTTSVTTSATTTSASFSEQSSSMNPHFNASVSSSEQSSSRFSVVFPPKVTSVGRPKGSGQTVVGLKHKANKKKSDGVKNVVPMKRQAEKNVKLKKFIELSFNDQGATIVTWLTNKSLMEIKKKKVSMDDIIQDSNMFNRLRNDAVDLKCVKPLVDKKCYNYLNEEVERLNSNTKRWACAKCRKNLSLGYQIMCNVCLDWYHIQCVGVSETDAKSLVYFCKSCLTP